MIMPRDKPPEKKRKPSKARPSARPEPPPAKDLLRAIERQLHAEGSIDQNAAYEAQQLIYEAMEAASDERETELILQALQLDPTNVDALLRIAQTSPLTGDEYLAVLREIVALGEKNLGPANFREMRGQFWGFVETRPYMRARAELADTLLQHGLRQEAVSEWEAMLELNPNDNQGVRYWLLSGYLTLGRLEDAQRLLAKYPDEGDYNAVFAWGKVLERYLNEDLPGAVTALQAARKQNPFMEDYLKGRRKNSASAPDCYAPGSAEEAACYAAMVCMAWRQQSDSLIWLKGQP